MRAILIKFLAFSIMLAGAAHAMQEQNAPSYIDYDGFLGLANEVDAYRQERLIDLESFLQMAQEEDTILLDTRSESAFAQGHLKGAINLPFSDFTEDKLQSLIGDTSRTILIYCNNNFSDNIAPVPLKRVDLALNVPTFINLYGYGYKNIYELDETISIYDPAIEFVSSE
ncbi:MAG: rhodanese-like domain-containing protein [bacterium]